jgi:hypothetical protein
MSPPHRSITLTSLSKAAVIAEVVSQPGVDSESDFFNFLGPFFAGDTSLPLIASLGIMFKTFCKKKKKILAKFKNDFFYFGPPATDTILVFVLG